MRLKSRAILPFDRGVSVKNARFAPGARPSPPADELADEFGVAVLRHGSMAYLELTA